jgi:prophage regulatory protein
MLDTNSRAAAASGGPRRLLRRPEVEARTGLSRSSIYERMADGSFPRQVPLSPGSVAWLEEEVEAWIGARLAARDRAGQREARHAR